jgi:hypothetical protein
MVLLRVTDEADCLICHSTEQSLDAHVPAGARSEPPLPRERFSPLAGWRPSLPMRQRPGAFAPGRSGQNTNEIGHSTRLRVVVVFREIGRLLAHAESARLLLESQGALAWCALIFLPVIAIAGFFSGSAVVTQWWRYVALLVVAFSRHGGDFLGPARVLAECAQSAATQPDADES